MLWREASRPQTADAVSCPLEIRPPPPPSVISAGAEPNHKGDDEMDDEPEAGALIEIDQIEDERARKEDGSHQGDEAVQAEGIERALDPRDGEGYPWQKEREDQEPERKRMQHEQAKHLEMPMLSREEEACLDGMREDAPFRNVRHRTRKFAGRERHGAGHTPA